MCALTGPASQLLWDMGAQENVTWKDLVLQLKARYGPEDQTSLYRIKLSTYRQGQGESLSNVVQEIRRMMALAYSGPSSDIVETVACDAFIDGLANQDLAQKVREREPANLEAAYKHAVRLDAYGRSSVHGNDMDRRHGRVKATKEEWKTSGAVMQETRRLEDLEREVKNLAKELGRFASKQQSGLGFNKPYQRASVSDTSAEETRKSEPLAQRPAFQPGRWRNPDIECFLCKQKGHVKRLCPKLTSESVPETRVGEPTKVEPVQEQAQSRLVKGSRMAYVVARLQGKRLHCLLDSGSEMSLVPRRLIQDAELKPSEQRLLAANGSAIKVDGETTLKIRVGKQMFSLPCLVTDQVTEVILGLSWLEINQARWDFASRSVYLGGEKIPLKEAVAESMCRKIVIEQDTVIPARSEVDVLASIVYPHFQEDNGNWTTMTTELSRDLIIGRTLVTGTEPNVCVRMVNVGDRDSMVKRSTECLLERVDLISAAVRLGHEDQRCPDQISSNIYMTMGTTEQRNEPEAEEVLKRLWEEVPADVPEDKREQLRELILSYRNTFSLSETDNGFTSVIQHEIDTQGEKPVRQALRRQPLSMLPEIDRQVEDMLKQGIVEPSASEWESNVVMVKKKDGSMRFCVDYRQLNLKTRKDAHPLPLIRESLDTLGGARWYSTFDLRAGYHQMALHPRDKHKTAFVTRRGSFQFKVLPFGLCNSPASFCRLMNLILAGLNYDICLVYLDDIIVFSRDIDTHMQRLEMVFRRLQEYNLKLKPSKCHLLQKRVVFLGHVLSEGGVATDPSKIKAVEDWVVPKNLRQVRSFIGLCSYYRRFIHDFAVVAQPLHFLTRKNVPFRWTVECQEAFEELKRRLVSSPILALPSDEGQYILDTDASAYAIGAVLSQMQEGQEKVICYASRLLSTAERNYNVTRRELLAVIYFLKEFRQYLLGRKFLLRIDHSALQWLRRTPEPIGQQARWLETIEEFDFEICHRAGTKHGNADAMSRGLIEEQSDVDEMKDSVKEVRWARPIEEITPLAKEGTDPAVGWTAEALRREQQNDYSIGPVLRWKESNHHPTEEEVTPSSEEVKVLVSNWNQLEIRQGVLYRGWVQGNTGEVERYQLIVPSSLRKEMFELTHASFAGGHFGIRKSIAQLQRRAYWPGWKEDVRRFCQRCDRCARYRREKPPRQGKLQNPAVGEQMERFGIDITGPHPVSSKGNKYILTAIDYFSRWAEALPIRNQEAVTVAEALMVNVFSRFGMPRQILTDQGPCFESNLFKELCKLMEIDKIRTTPYRPSGNGMIERFHRTLNMLLGKVVSERQKDWDLHVPYIIAAYPSTEHEATQRTPNFLFLGRENHAPLDLILAQVIGLERPIYQDLEEYVEKQKEKMDTAYRLVREQLKRTAERRKKAYDLRVRPNKFSQGEWVYYYCPRLRSGRKTKWARFYTGPFLIVQVLSPILYRIQKSARSNQMVVHVDKLKSFYGNPQRNWTTEVERNPTELVGYSELQPLEPDTETDIEESLEPPAEFRSPEAPDVETPRRRTIRHPRWMDDYYC